MKRRLKKVFGTEWQPKSYIWAVNNVELSKGKRQEAKRQRVHKLTKAIQATLNKTQHTKSDARRAMVPPLFVFSKFCTLFFCSTVLYFFFFVNEINIIGAGYDRREKTYPKVCANQRDFVQAGKNKRKGVYLGAINTLRAASMGEVGSENYVSQRELNRYLGIGERKKLIWDMNASQRAQFMANDPTFTSFENPNARREVRRHTDKNINLCKLWYLSFKLFSGL